MAELYDRFRNRTLIFSFLGYLFILILSSQSLAGIGVYVGGFSGKVESYNSSFTFNSDPDDYADSNLKRDQSGTSGVIGIDYTFKVYNKLDMSVGVDFAMHLYNATYTPSSSSSRAGNIIKEEMDFVRASFEVSALYNWRTIQVENVRITLVSGGGLSLSGFMLPVTSDELRKNVNSSDEQISLEKHAAAVEESVLGTHIIGAVKFQTDSSNLGVKIFTEIHVFPKVSDEIDFADISFGLGVFWKK